MNIEAIPYSLEAKSRATSVIDLARQNKSPLKVLSTIEVDYPETIQFELISFFEKSKFWIPGDMILSGAKDLNCNDGERLAGILYDNQDQLPQEIEKYVLVFPGTVWIPEEAMHKGLTILSKDPGEPWEIGFVGIGGMNAPKNARFVKVLQQ